MAKVLSVVGNRPQYVKAAPLCVALAARAEVVGVDTGQHYDPELSQVFYDELGIAPPAHRLEVGSGSHAEMTARILERIEPVLVAERPDWCVVYGDTNSTIAAALAAAKLGIPLAHVEAGLRSFDRSMPEEVNRVLTDRVSDALLCPSQTGADNLAAEGITAGVHVVGDVMADAARLFGPIAERSMALADLGLEPGGYLLATIHREANTRPPALGRLVDALSALDADVLLPLHPRTAAALDREGLAFGGRVRVVPPVPYLAFTALLRGARALLTDSGGAQKEAWFHAVPCITLRDRTEWIETVAAGGNVLVGDDREAIAAAVATPPRPDAWPPLYGDGHAAERIASVLLGS
ncbi:MAG: non-hydrolyzing UDP-N-acetylglucosamine 2-epimerase [Gaiellales bacterium]